jgi:hypothetical protein
MGPFTWNSSFLDGLPVGSKGPFPGQGMIYYRGRINQFPSFRHPTSDIAAVGIKFFCLGGWVEGLEIRCGVATASGPRE